MIIRQHRQTPQRPQKRWRLIKMRARDSTTRDTAR